MTQTTTTKCDGCGKKLNVDADPHIALQVYAAFMPYATDAKALHFHEECWPEKIDAAELKPAEA